MARRNSRMKMASKRPSRFRLFKEIRTSEIPIQFKMAGLYAMALGLPQLVSASRSNPRLMAVMTPAFVVASALALGMNKEEVKKAVKEIHDFTDKEAHDFVEGAKKKEKEAVKWLKEVF